MARLEDIELPEGDAARTLHLNPASDFHPHVLLPGDPARAMAIATKHMTAPRMFNHRRGLWGYSGRTEAGAGLLVQSSGMGGPSAAIIAEELCDLGAELIVRVGTCGALDPSIALGDVIVVRSALCEDGASRALAAPPQLPADQDLASGLEACARADGRVVHTGTIATVDLFYDPAANQRHRELIERGAIALEMECAAVFAVAARRGIRAACILGVTDLISDGRDRLTHDAIGELGEDIGSIAVATVAKLAG